MLMCGLVMMSLYDTRTHIVYESISGVRGCFCWSSHCVGGGGDGGVGVGSSINAVTRLLARTNMHYIHTIRIRHTYGHTDNQEAILMLVAHIFEKCERKIPLFPSMCLMHFFFTFLIPFLICLQLTVTVTVTVTDKTFFEVDQCDVVPRGNEKERASERQSETPRNRTVKLATNFWSTKKKIFNNTHVHMHDKELM